MLYLNQLAQFLDQFLLVQRFEHDPSGIYHPSNRPIRRLGLALEPWPQIAKWVAATQVDALFLHRPWKIAEEPLPTDIGVLSYHLTFDERLTLGFNPLLANHLGLFSLEELGYKAGRPIGMLGQVSEQTVASFCDRVQHLFRGYEAIAKGNLTEVTKVAVVGAMTEALVREASTKGAAVYITGQFRQPARSTVLETGINVVAIGHHRSEIWGLQALADVLRDRWPDLEVILPPS